MVGSLLNRLIFWELLKVFLMSLGTLTGLLVTAGLLQQAAQMGLSLMQVVKSIPLFVPSTLPYTIPATTLFASCVVYGRLSHDNEVVAIKAAGVHLATILKPAVVLGVITTLVTAAISHSVIPISQQLFFRQLTSDPEELLYSMLRRDRCIRHPKLPYVIYVKDVQGKRLIDMVLKERRKYKDPISGQELFNGYKMVARAREARLHVDPVDGKLYLNPDRMVMYNEMSPNEKASGTTPPPGHFEMDLPEGLNGKDKIRISAMTWEELGVKIAGFQEELDGLEQKREDERKAAESITNPDLRDRIRQRDNDFKWRIETLKRIIRNIEAEYHTRPALALGCLLFALLGCPVGIWANRADYLSTFVICFLPALFVYYPLLLAGSGMGKDGKFPLGLGCYLADIVIGTAALFLNVRLLRR
jgi:lipopolysaccharide export system permease protein